MNFHPPLVNSASPWATTEEDLRALYECPSTGAITVRTSLLLGWNHDPSVNQYIFYDASRSSQNDKNQNGCARCGQSNVNSSLNTLGYSPIPLDEYLEIIERIVSTSTRRQLKPWIVSVTGSAEEIVECYKLIREQVVSTGIPMHVEINLSCPNIANKPPPAYSSEMLSAYLVELQIVQDEPGLRIPVGIKVPPYTYAGQFDALIEAMLSVTPQGRECPISFVTSTNTLGNSLLLRDSMAYGLQYDPLLSSVTGTGIGGLGGTAIHPLSLGNVRTLRIALDRHEELQHVEIIGVGGVSDYAGYARMRSAGASVVGVGTAFGVHGIGVFDSIMNNDQESLTSGFNAMTVDGAAT